MRNEVLIKRLKEAMAAEKISMAALSRKAGLGETYVRDLIVGRVKDASSEYVSKLAKALGTSTAWLMGEKDATASQPALGCQIDPVIFAQIQGVIDYRLKREKQFNWTKEEYARLLVNTYNEAVRIDGMPEITKDFLEESIKIIRETS